MRLPLFHGRKGFTLLELLVVMCIISVAAGSLTITSSVASLEKGTEECVIRETKRFERWLKTNFHKACLFRRSFSFLSLPCSTPVDKICIKWNDTNEREYFDTEGNCYFTVRGSAVTYSVYTPQWQTLSPSFTLKAVRSPDNTSAVKYVIISLYSSVRISDDPPEN